MLSYVGSLFAYETAAQLEFEYLGHELWSELTLGKGDGMN